MINRRAKFDGGVIRRRSSSHRQQANGPGNNVANVFSWAGCLSGPARLGDIGCQLLPFQTETPGRKLQSVSRGTAAWLADG